MLHLWFITSRLLLSLAKPVLQLYPQLVQPGVIHLQLLQGQVPALKLSRKVLVLHGGVAPALGEVKADPVFLLPSFVHRLLVFCLLLVTSTCLMRLVCTV